MTLFAWLAIAVGVWAMSSFLAVMYGFESSLKQRVLKAYPHIIVRPKSGSLGIRNY
jgi:ABC-type lipoprotein release transport system permease subunit